MMRTLLLAGLLLLLPLGAAPATLITPLADPTPPHFPPYRAPTYTPPPAPRPYHAPQRVWHRGRHWQPCHHCYHPRVRM
jgi:hypothetical protein